MEPERARELLARERRASSRRSVVHTGRRAAGVRREPRARRRGLRGPLQDELDAGRAAGPPRGAGRRRACRGASGGRNVRALGAQRRADPRGRLEARPTAELTVEEQQQRASSGPGSQPVRRHPLGSRRSAVRPRAAASARPLAYAGYPPSRRPAAGRRGRRRPPDAPRPPRRSARRCRAGRSRRSGGPSHRRRCPASVNPKSSRLPV